MAAQTGVANQPADGPAPGFRRAIKGHRQSVQDTSLGPLDHFARNTAVIQSKSEMRKTLRGVHRIKLADNFGAGFFEHVAHLHC